MNPSHRPNRPVSRASSERPDLAAARSWTALAAALTLAWLGTGCERGGPECEEPLTVCDNACVDTSVDPFHCGACGSACAAGFVCAEGVCACPAGETPCEGRCVRLDEDVRACGACGNACAAGELCVEGACEESCPETDRCDGACVDLAADEENCGACGQSCEAFQTCGGGVCGCPEGRTECDGACVDLGSDPANCGACGTACDGATPFCATDAATGTGACVPSCEAPASACGEACVNLQTDAANCGACARACGDEERCVDGGCACASGVRCGEACVDTASDAQHCGGCGIGCGAGELCADGSCACAAGERCGEACVDTATDEQNCGGCGIGCGAGLQCLGGICAVGDLYAACFGAGEVAPFLRSGPTATGPRLTGVDGPQSLALLAPNHLLVLGSLDDTLHVVDRATMQEVGTASLGAGACANQVLVRGARAYVLKSCVNTVQVIDLADPSAPVTVDEVSTGDSTNPYGAAFDEAGRLWVSLWLTGQVVAIDFSGASGVAGAPITLPVAEGTPYPAGVAVLGGVAYVALNNLDANYAPAGNGRLAPVPVDTQTPGDLVDLGADCRNAGFLAVHDGRLHVACTGSYADDGAVLALDPATGATDLQPTGGAPTRLSAAGDTVYATDSLSTSLLAISPAGITPLEACPAGAWEFVADVLAVP